MGAEHSQQRAEADGREIFEGDLKNVNQTTGVTAARSGLPSTSTGAIKKRTMLRQNTAAANSSSSSMATNKLKQTNDSMPSPTTSEMSRPSSPPLSVCSDLPYVSYTTDRPIGDSPKIRGKSANSLTGSAAAAQRNSLVLRRPQTGGAKPKRPQSTVGSHSIVIVKPGIKDANEEIETELQQLQSIPQFLPVLRDSINSATFTKDAECLERLQIQPHLLNICSRMQAHLNMCATLVAQEQSHLVERTKVVSNSITTLFASFVDMQKSYAAYAEQFNKVRLISQQLSRCNSLLNDNLASLEAINNFLDIEDRLEPFVWRTDDNKVRGEAEGAAAAAAALAAASGSQMSSIRFRRL